MTSPISPGALKYVRARATDAMTYVCRIERVAKPTYDETTLIASTGSRTTIYEGACRIWEVTGPGVVMLGEEEYSTQTTNLSIPWNTSPVPIRHDEGVITESDLDPIMVGKRFVILDVAKSGQLRATRRFTIQLKQEG
jgi:hypothetical protein